jgi:hypothetical protein
MIYLYNKFGNILIKTDQALSQILRVFGSVWQMRMPSSSTTLKIADFHIAYMQIQNDSMYMYLRE